MSVLELLGSIGVGTVLGWITGMLKTSRVSMRLVLAALVASSAMLLEVAWLVGWIAALAAIGGWIISLFIHQLWLKDLRGH